MKIYKLKCIKKKEIKEIAKEIKNGKIAVFPTDTVYGIGTNAFYWHGVKQIYKIKKRKDNKPMPILIDNISQLKKIVKIVPGGTKKLMEKFWPGPLTLVFETNELGTMLMAGKKSVAARIPDNKILLSIIKEMGQPLIGTSINVSGCKDCRSISDINKRILKDIDIIIDGGKTKIGKASTVLDVSRFPYILVRAGAITKKEIEKIVNT
ncbi:MAG: threonylcarbamoyl-AMP synthase [Elusimicrobia bacterium RIFOXYD2_FULL_34_15]|nr:MAG: threonylcarbamoyl-AMP synthase [Elusimicrobia bacterium RIFOXYD2_FULL_34_15]